MKKLLIILLLIVGCAPKYEYATVIVKEDPQVIVKEDPQDYCSDVIGLNTTIDDFTNVKTVTTKFIEIGGHETYSTSVWIKMSMQRSYFEDGGEILSFNLYFKQAKVGRFGCIDANSSIMMKFATDGEVIELKNFNNEIECGDYNNSFTIIIDTNNESNKNIWRSLGVMPTDDIKEKLLTKRIEKIRIYGTERSQDYILTKKRAFIDSYECLYENESNPNP